MIIDNHGRPLQYLRLAVTDRCNLRCFYCMPEHGMKFLSRDKILSYEEMLRLCSLLAEKGVYKLRITGGEPFVRKDLDYFLKQLTAIRGLDHLYITTNGVLTEQYIPLLEELNFKGVNLSLDSLDRENFRNITKRDDFEKVMSAFNSLVKSRLKLKINMVVMKGRNEHEVQRMAQLAVGHDVEVRYIEEMPFNGTERTVERSHWSWKHIQSDLLLQFPQLQKQATEKDATAQVYKAPGMRGSLGIIPAFSRTFCGTCNRIRITASGLLKTCLYDNGVLNLKQLLVKGVTDAELWTHMSKAFGQRAKDGFEAEKGRERVQIEESMASIGG